MLNNKYLSRNINLAIVIFSLLVIGIETNRYWHLQFWPWLPSSRLGRLVFYYSFFTVLSNLMLALSCLLLAIKPNSDKLGFNIIRLSGIVGITITAIVYNLMLRGIYTPPTPLLTFTNESLHVILPILGLLSWLISGYFRRIDIKVIFGSFCILLAYGIYIFVRGYYTGRYPYPFINVNKIGYEKALFAVGGIAILFFVLVLLVFFIEKIRSKYVTTA